MQTTATVNYHIKKPEEQAFHIDAGGVEGKIISPVLMPTEVNLRDVRVSDNVTFVRDSVAFVQFPSAVSSFEPEQHWRDVYDQELREILALEIGAKEVIIFDHTVRTDDPTSMRKPARNVHSDYSPTGAHQRLRDLLGDEKAAAWEEGHFGFINVWRPIEAPINSAPLGFVRPSSVEDDDWLMIKLIYPDRIGSIMGLAANGAHDWIYLSKMRPDEIAIFNIYDNHGRPSIAHSALDMIEDNSLSVIRKSIESRMLVRY